MKHLTVMKVLGIGVALCGAFFAACSSGSSNNGGNGGGNNTGGGSGGGSGGGVNPSCTGLSVMFAPSYSAFEGSHTYQIPFIVSNGNMADVTWKADNDSLVQLAAAQDNLGTAIEMATITGAGTVTITATDKSGNCGQSVLTIASATSADWDIGNQRYNNGVVFTRPDGGFSHDAGGLFDGSGGGGPPPGFDAAALTELACTNCHGDNTNPSIRFKDVQHTPEQTGGFTDDELIAIFTQGQVPDGGYFDPSVICPDARPCSPDQAYARWQGFHQWSMTDEETHGIVVYLRSLAPKGQTGTTNFPPRHHDGGGPPPPQDDSGSGGGGGNDSGGD